MILHVIFYFAGFIAVVVLLLFCLDKYFATKGYRGLPSDHFNGDTFFNNKPSAEGKTFESTRPQLIKWMLNRSRSFWKWRENQKYGKPLERVNGSDIHVTFVNHATVLLQVAGLNILTDPIWSKRSSPLAFFGPERHRPPGIIFEDLPPIDVVLLSHNHYDHMDVPTLGKIYNKWHPKIFVGLGNSKYLESQKIIGAKDMDWWDKISLTDNVKVTFVPAQHFCARALSDRNKTLWGGFVLTTPEGSIYFAGDTGYGPFIEKIKQRFTNFRLALLPIGSYKPEWFMKPMHISPDEALKIHNELHVQTSVAIHFGTFRMADDGQDEAPERMKELLTEKSNKADFRVLDHGERIILRVFIG